MKPSINVALLAYSVISTTLIAGVLASEAFSRPRKAAYDEIDVGRINVREDDGRLRMVITNASRSPGLLFRGKEHPHPTRRAAGALFYNEEGTETGGLGFSGKTENGKITSYGHLSFDQYEQDQTVQITHAENDGTRWAGLMVSDYADGPMGLEEWERAEAMPDGAAKQAELERLKERYGSKRRLFVGRNRDRASDIGLYDAAGRIRIRLQVTADGAASIQFLDEAGKTVRSIVP